MKISNGAMSQLTEETTTPNKRFLKIAGESWPPFFEIDDSAEENRYSGIMWTMLNFLSNAMDFDFEIIRPPDGKWGIGDNNGSWNGMLGMVKRNEVDFALGPFGVIREREEACDFTVPILIDYWTAVVPIQPYQDLWTVFRPFGIKLWVALALTTLLFASIVIICHYSFFGPEKGKTYLPKIISFTLRNILEEPSEWIPEEFTHQRIFSASWMLAFIIIGKSYSGTLASLLTVPNIPIPINSVQDLVSQDKLPWTIEVGSILDQLGGTARPGSTFQKLYTGAKENGIIGPNCVFFKNQIREGLYGSVCERTSIAKILSDDFTETGKCNFYVGEVDLFATSFAMAFQEGSLLLPEVNQWILTMLQMGLYSRWELEILPNKTSCAGLESIKNSMGKKNLALSITETFGLFLILLIGLGMSMIAFFFENGCRYKFF